MLACVQTSLYEPATPNAQAAATTDYLYVKIEYGSLSSLSIKLMTVGKSLSSRYCRYAQLSSRYTAKPNQAPSVLLRTANQPAHIERRRCVCVRVEERQE